MVGVGGSALAAGILDAVAGPSGPVPVIGHHDYGLPGWVGVADVVLAVSASGSAAETLSAVEEAYRRGCRLAVVSPADTPHGAFGRARPGAVRRGSRHETRPARTTLWSLVVPLLAVGRSLGVIREGDAAIEAAAGRLEEMASRCRPTSESFVNPAKMLALELAGSIPLIWGTSRLTAVAAERAVSQLAANARYPAVAGALPHPAHDQIAMFDGVFGSGAGGVVGAGGGAGAGAGAGDDIDEFDDFFRDRVDDEQTDPAAPGADAGPEQRASRSDP